MSIAVLAIGSEILDGRVLDTNSQFIAQELNNIGLQLSQTMVCDDVIEEIVHALTYLATRTKIIVVTGGLGPTTDDLTRESIAQFIGAPLIQNDASLIRLKDLYQARKRAFDESNCKQALFPTGAEIIHNPIGTAEGFHIKKESLVIFSFPGVPKELKPMFTQAALPIIQATLPHRSSIHRSAFRIFGLPESVVGARINALTSTREINISYRATFPEIHVVLKHHDISLLQGVTKEAVDAVGQEFVFANDEQTSFPDSVSQTLIDHNATISVAESCTGGLLGAYLTNRAGSSAYFIGGIQSYSNEIKVRALGVQSEAISLYGAVSHEVAKQMAQGVREKMGTTIGISITGVAGPDGGSEEKPVGTFYVGIADQTSCEAYHFFFRSDRYGIRKFGCYAALDVVRRKLLQLPNLSCKFSNIQSLK